MDGTAYITQCPILPRESFTYRFKASPVGTHWYHSQFSHQMMDGLFGMLIVHPALPTMPYFIANVMDWWNFEGNDIEIANPYGNMYKGTGEFQEYVTNRRYSHDNNELGTVSYFSVLVNGRGRQILNEKYPLERFKVTKDNQYRFRMAHTGAELSLAVTIDSHKLQVNYSIKSLLILLGNSMTSTSFVFTELANTMKYGGGFLYNLVFTEWRYCVSQNEV